MSSRELYRVLRKHIVHFVVESGKPIEKALITKIGLSGSLNDKTGCRSLDPYPDLVISRIFISTGVVQPSLLTTSRRYPALILTAPSAFVISLCPKNFSIGASDRAPRDFRFINDFCR